MVTFGTLGNLDGSEQIRTVRLATTENQFELFKRLYDSYENVFILESLVGPEELAEMSVIGFGPEITVTCDFQKFTVREKRKVIHQVAATDPLMQLREIMPKVKDSRSRYIGGAVGYVGYDAVRFWERLPLGKKKDGNYPLLEFGIYTDGILYNHKEDQAYYFFVGQSRLDELQRKLAVSSSKPSRFSYSMPRRDMTKGQFVKMVRKAKRYVYDGDVFQVVIAKSMKFRVKGNIIGLYENLRKVNPSPYMYLLKMSNRFIVGSSPEMLVRVTGDRVETFPIAGTRPVVRNEARNEKLRKELLRDEKELAEHTMLVDLARNDIGRVCEFGTVRLNELMTVKRFSHVQHIVSHVTGRLKEKYDCYDALRAVFPAGTVSGAPKVRAMEVIDELEPTLRGPYAGALGYFSFNGSCDFAITIRSLFVNKNVAYIEAGAGIVMDSDPEREWEETEHKANAMLTALKMTSAK